MFLFHVIYIFSLGYYYVCGQKFGNGDGIRYGNKDGLTNAYIKLLGSGASPFLRPIKPLFKAPKWKGAPKF